MGEFHPSHYDHFRDLSHTVPTIVYSSAPSLSFYCSSTMVLRFKSLFFFPFIKLLDFPFSLHFSAAKFKRYYHLLSFSPMFSYSAFIHSGPHLLTLILGSQSFQDFSVLIMLSFKLLMTEIKFLLKLIALLPHQQKEESSLPLKETSHFNSLWNVTPSIITLSEKYCWYKHNSSKTEFLYWQDFNHWCILFLRLNKLNNWELLYCY